MKYLLKRNNSYYYNRRVPDNLRSIVKKEHVRITLKTTDYMEAVSRAASLDKQINEYWASLLNDAPVEDGDLLKRIVDRAKLLDFRYQSNSKLVNSDMDEILSRLLTLLDNNTNPKDEDALLGLANTETMTMTIKQALNRYWDFTKDKTMNKSENQIRKWRAPRVKAINNFIKVCGNLQVHKVSRDDALTFRDWWISRIEDEKLSETSANKDIIHVKNILQTVCDNEDLNIPIDNIFRKLTLKERFFQSRKPLSSEHINGVLLNPDNHNGLENDLVYFLHAMADTGARSSEITGLEPEDIVLNVPVPYISIKDRPYRPLKTPHSARVIPLVGHSLFAFKKRPNGFTKYRDKTDILSSKLNKYLRSNGLFPSEQHSVYSLRHSFQDRLLAVDAPDRIQAELMGHKFHRPKYGDGGSLEHKYKWMKKIQLLKD